MSKNLITRAFYGGSFDPLTLGHVDMIQKAIHTFETVVIGIGVNPAKKPMFTPEERKNILIDVFAAYVEVGSMDIIIYQDFLVHEAISHQCTHIVRGVRNARDLEDEMGMAEMNKHIAMTHPMLIPPRDRGYTNPQTIFIPSPSNLALVSSSMVKSLIGFGDWQEQIKAFVPLATYDAIINKYNSGR